MTIIVDRLLIPNNGHHIAQNVSSILLHKGKLSYECMTWRFSCVRGKISLSKWFDCTVYWPLVNLVSTPGEKKPQWSKYSLSRVRWIMILVSSQGYTTSNFQYTRQNSERLVNFELKDNCHEPTVFICKQETDMCLNKVLIYRIHTWKRLVYCYQSVNN